MSEKKAKKARKDKRTPADKLILDFLSLHNIVLIVDKINQLDSAAEGRVYQVNEKLRVRAVFSDQIKKKVPQKLSDMDKKVEVVN